MSAEASKPLDQWQAFEVSVKPEEKDLKITFLRGDLEPETSYYIRVQPENDYGKGLPSEPTHFVTVSGGKNLIFFFINFFSSFGCPNRYFNKYCIR